MIISYSFQNYKSFPDKQFFSMERPSGIKTEKDSIEIFEPSEKKLSRVAAIYGANAAGKTNFLESLECLQQLVVQSNQNPTSFVSMQNNSTFFELVFISLNQKRYKYTLNIFRNTVVYEKLDVYNSVQPTNILEYKDNVLSLGATFKDDERTALNYFFSKDHHRPLISQFKNSNSEDAKGAYLFFEQKLLFRSPGDNDFRPNKFSDIIDDNPKIHKFVTQALLATDLGIKSIDIANKEDNVSNNKKAILAEMLVKFYKEDHPDASREQIERMRALTIESNLKEAVFVHEINNTLAKFGMADESNGTLAAMNIYIDLIPILENGLVYVIDEIDRSLHPSVVSQIIDIFNSAELNPHGAQLIFTTHDVSLLDSSIYGENILDRDEVWFIEKNLNGASTIYPLTQIKYSTKQGDNIYRKYISGRYGAVPKVSLAYAVQLYWESIRDE